MATIKHIIGRGKPARYARGLAGALSLRWGLRGGKPARYARGLAGALSWRLSIGREKHIHPIIHAEKTTLPPPISTISDIDGGRCVYIEAHQAHERRPLRAPLPLRARSGIPPPQRGPRWRDSLPLALGSGRAPLQAVAGRYAPPPHFLSADAIGRARHLGAATFGGRGA